MAVCAVGSPKSPEDETDERRHYYGLTQFGREVLARETATLERIVAYARLQEIV